MSKHTKGPWIVVDDDRTENADAPYMVARVCGKSLKDDLSKASDDTGSPINAAVCDSGAPGAIPENVYQT